MLSVFQNAGLAHKRNCWTPTARVISVSSHQLDGLADNDHLFCDEPTFAAYTDPAMHMCVGCEGVVGGRLTPFGFLHQLYPTRL